MRNHKYFKHLMLVLLIAFAAVQMMASSITDAYFGNPIDGYDARNFGMGSAGTFNDLRPFGIAANPANLTLMKAKAGFTASLLLDRNEDNRHVPLYNSFDSYIDDAVYASNIDIYDNYAAAGFGALKMGEVRVGMGAFYAPMLSFDGDYIEEIRNNRNTDNDGYPEKLATNRIENRGTLDQAAGIFSIGYDFNEITQLNFGFQFGMLEGKQEFAKTIRWSQWAIDTFATATGNDPNKVLPNYSLTTDAKLEGAYAKLGLAMRVNERFGFAGTWVPKSVLDRTGSTLEHRDAYRNTAELNQLTDIDEDYVLPSNYRLGVLYQPRNIMRTWLNLDLEYVQFSEISEHYDDQFNFYAGVEHWVENRLPLRIGFAATNSYLREVEADGSLIVKRILTPKLTAGSGFAITDWMGVDLGFGYSWREYEAQDLFKDSYYNDKLYSGSSSYALWPNQYINLADRDWSNPDKIRENDVTLRAALSITW
ncbi:MAG TPA: hypothetical protein GX398_04765 [Candidatus Cloacimonetes bacterium]|jgi:hypothetical protein|nr:hypothetical protein [Candidatus Cloacimonadota bacterium]